MDYYLYILLLIIIITGILLMYFFVNEKKCPDPVIEYRFVPRTFKEEQENPTSVNDLFSNMFQENSILP
jgi:hypothetical protein